MVCVHTGGVNSTEVDELCAGNESRYTFHTKCRQQTGEPYSTETDSDVSLRSGDTASLVKMRCSRGFYEKHCKKGLCVGCLPAWVLPVHLLQLHLSGGSVC